MNRFRQYLGLVVICGALVMMSATAWASSASSSSEAAPAHGAAAGHGGGHQLGHPPAPPEPVHWLGSGLDQAGKDTHGGTYEPAKGDEKMSPAFIWMVVNFGLMLFILGWKVVPILRNYAGNRHDNIQGSLDEAQRLHAEAKQMLAEYADKIKDVDKEVDELITGIRSDAEAERKRIIADAEKYAAAMKKDAEDRIANELQTARAELEREVIAVAIAAAEKILSEKTTPMDHKALIDTFIIDVGAASAGAPKELS